MAREIEPWEVHQYSLQELMDNMVHVRFNDKNLWGETKLKFKYVTAEEVKQAMRVLSAEDSVNEIFWNMEFQNANSELYLAFAVAKHALDCEVYAFHCSLEEKVLKLADDLDMHVHKEDVKAINAALSNYVQEKLKAAKNIKGKVDELANKLLNDCGKANKGYEEAETYMSFFKKKKYAEIDRVLHDIELCLTFSHRKRMQSIQHHVEDEMSKRASALRPEDGMDVDEQGCLPEDACNGHQMELGPPILETEGETSSIGETAKRQKI